MEYTPRMLDAALSARSAAAASIVLLKNVQNTLPLLPEADAALPVAVFGIGQIFTPCCTKRMQPWRQITILDGLMASGSVKPDGLLAHRYRTWALEHPTGAEYPVSMLRMEEFAGANHAAIAVIARAPEDPSRTLSVQETELLAAVRKAFPRTVLVLATPGFVELNDAAMGFDAIVYLGIAGQEAGAALADVLTAKAIPSGKLAFSWPVRLGAFDEANARRDAFVGYRYFDSFGTELRWPFGYGLGYGACALGSVSVGLDGTDVSVSAEVENIGETWAAREAVQVYVSRPDKTGAQPVWALNCFARTRLLAPGERETVHLRFPVTELAAFRAAACAYVLEEGYYDIRVGFNARSTYLAGSLRSMQNAMVRAVTPLQMAHVPGRVRTPGAAFTYPEESAELEQARRYAIRISPRNLPKRSRKKGSNFEGCRGDDTVHTLAEVRQGRCSLFTMIAGMDTASLRRLTGEFGRCPAAVCGALAASPALERFGIPAVQMAEGGEGLYLTREVKDEDDEIVRRQHVTAFPAASLLGCSFDTDTVRGVGRAIGREMQEFGISLWMAPELSLLADPRAAGAAGQWSEDPIVVGTLGAAMSEGISKYGAAVLRGGKLPVEEAPDAGALRDVWMRPFEIAAGSYRAALLPEGEFGGEKIGEDAAIVRSWIVDCRYRGAFLAEGERYSKAAERVELERSALRLLRLVLEL